MVGQNNFYNAGKTYDERLQNAFTAYLLRIAIHEQSRCAFVHHRNNALLLNQAECELFEKGSVNFQSLEKPPNREQNPASWHEFLQNLDSERLYKALGKLTDEEANILFLHVILDLRYTEIERITKIPAKKVQHRYTMTIRKIRRAMESGKNK